ncbi:hypothetical protein ELQ90_15630 [Labedella phragmitis]|uniref:Choice-of-anchor G family protein n=1 Tax=Labedella phragmitis TaxID=2498849 RepID=A0A3S3ZHK1_9MICO|nr:choice-of-anchor G family protein [Labedella phragmitis]RWZ46200.1 hypothetical protein ELQ90_15630 [Labedella phragmitis]
MRSGHRHAPSPGRIGRRAVCAIAALVVLAIVPPNVSATVAAWNDAEWGHATVGTSSFDCGTDTGHTTAANSTFLRGELLGQDLDDIAELEELVLVRPADGPALVQPASAVDLGSDDADPNTDTFGRPLAVDLLDGIVGLDLTGLEVGLPAGSAGAVNQVTRVTTTGSSAAASGLVDDSGALLVSSETPTDQFPEPARLSLEDIVPDLEGVVDPAIEIGAVGSRADLDWCAAAESAAWGDGSVTGVTREYGIASLALDVDSPTIGVLTSAASSTVTSLDAALSALAGTGGLVSSALRDSIVSALVSGLSLGALTGSVSITGVDLARTLEPFLVTPLSDGVVTIDPSTGSIRADLAGLLGDDIGGVNDLPPNSELIIDAQVVDDLVARTGDLLDTWTAVVVSSLRSALLSARIVVDVAAVVSLGATRVVSLDVDLDAAIAEVLAGSATVTVDTDVLGLVSVLDAVLAVLGISVSGLVSTLLGLGPTLLAAVGSQLTASLIDPLTSAGSSLAALTAPVVGVLDVLVSALPSVLSIMVNVQPDQPGAPPGPLPEGPTEVSSGRFSVSALRVGFLDALVPNGGPSYIELATSEVGPNRLPPPS